MELAESSDTYYYLKERRVKEDGSVRDIYAVRQPLKSVLQKLNTLFSNRCKFPNYLTGSLPGWSYVKNAKLHAGQGTVITVDATNFFPSISEQLVHNIWREFYCFAEDASLVLTDLCCYEGNLVQGNPISSYLANLVFWDIEPLIVQEFHKRGYRYSRYVDDIAVSHKRQLSPKEKTWVVQSAKKVFRSKGLVAKNRKTKVMDRHVRQEVHKRTVNAGRVCSTKERKDNLRASLKRFEDELASGNVPNVPFEKQFNRLRSQIYDFRQFNKTAANKMLERLKIAFGKPHKPVN